MKVYFQVGGNINKDTVDNYDYYFCFDNGKEYIRIDNQDSIIQAIKSGNNEVTITEKNIEYKIKFVYSPDIVPNNKMILVSVLKSDDKEKPFILNLKSILNTVAPTKPVVPAITSAATTASAPRAISATTSTAPSVAQPDVKPLNKTLLVFDFDCTLTTKHFFSYMNKIAEFIKTWGTVNKVESPLVGRFYELYQAINSETVTPEQQQLLINEFFGGNQRFELLRNGILRLRKLGCQVIIASRGIKPQIISLLKCVGLQDAFPNENVFGQPFKKNILLNVEIDSREFTKVFYADDDNEEHIKLLGMYNKDVKDKNEVPYQYIFDSWLLNNVEYNFFNQLTKNNNTGITIPFLFRLLLNIEGILSDKLCMHCEIPTPAEWACDKERCGKMCNLHHTVRHPDNTPAATHTRTKIEPIVLPDILPNILPLQPIVLPNILPLQPIVLPDILPLQPIVLPDILPQIINEDNMTNEDLTTLQQKIEIQSKIPIKKIESSNKYQIKQDLQNPSRLIIFTLQYPEQIDGEGPYKKGKRNIEYFEKYMELYNNPGVFPGKSGSHIIQIYLRRFGLGGYANKEKTGVNSNITVDLNNDDNSYVHIVLFSDTEEYKQKIFSKIGPRTHTFIIGHCSTLSNYIISDVKSDGTQNKLEAKTLSTMLNRTQLTDIGTIFINACQAFTTFNPTLMEHLQNKRYYLISSPIPIIRLAGENSKDIFDENQQHGFITVHTEQNDVTNYKYIDIFTNEKGQLDGPYIRINRIDEQLIEGMKQLLGERYFNSNDRKATAKHLIQTKKTFVIRQISENGYNEPDNILRSEQNIPIEHIFILQTDKEVTGKDSVHMWFALHNGRFYFPSEYNHKRIVDTIPISNSININDVKNLLRRLGYPINDDSKRKYLKYKEKYLILKELIEK